MTTARPLVYFVANENVGDGLLQAQLVQPLKGSGLWGRVSVINLIHPFSRRRREVDGVRTVRLGIPARLYQFRLFGALDWAVSMYYALILLALVPRGARVVARSYYSALAIDLLKRLKDIDLVFDTRSQFVQENESAGKLRRGSLAHRFWLGTEARLLRRASKVIAVSDAQAAYYKQLQPQAAVSVVPCFGQPDFALLSDASRREARERMGFAEDDIVVCYYGSLDRKWNHIDVYKAFFADCLARGCKLCVLTPAADELLADPALATPSSYIKRVDDPLQARALMSACDYGVIVMARSADWESRLGVKFVEYLCAGLQVLVGQWVGTAARLATERFAATSHVLATDPPRLPAQLQRLDAAGRADVARRAEQIFGYQRMKQVFDD
jgi:hypothetical protein